MNKVAEIIIQANDNANGILHLSSATVAVTEGINWNFLNVTRSGGTFGQVCQLTKVGIKCMFLQ